MVVCRLFFGGSVLALRRVFSSGPASVFRRRLSPAVSGGDRRIQSLNYVDADKAEEYQLAKAKAPAALNGDTGAGADGKNGENGGTQA